MASSNRHWPSMFKSKPCNNSTHHQWQHDVNSSLVLTGCHRSPHTSGPGCEERTPDPKPRWNPRPEQIRILEAIFNSGMVNPPRDEIRRIRAQLQEYGQVGDANVFYWFQNRKSRSKHKQRQLQNAKSQTQPPPAAAVTTNITTTVAPSFSTSSDKSSSPNSSNEKSLSVAPTTVIELLSSPTASVNQPFLQTPSEYLAEPLLVPVHQNFGGPSVAQGFCFPDLSGVADLSAENCPGFPLSELLVTPREQFRDMMMMSQIPSKHDEDYKMQLQQCLNFDAPSSAQPIVPSSISVPSPTNENLQGAGVGEQGPTKLVFINDVCFEVGVGPFNVREAFGDGVVLVQSSGQPVLTNEWGVTHQPLQHAAFYYLARTAAPSTLDRAIDLI